MLAYRNVFHVVSALQSIVFIHFLGADQVSCRSYVGSAYRMRSLVVSWLRILENDDNTCSPKTGGVEPRISNEDRNRGKRLVIFCVWSQNLLKLNTTFNSLEMYEKLAAAVCLPQNKHNLVISRCCFEEDGKENYKDYNASTQLLSCSLNILFGGGIVAVKLVLCLTGNVLFCLVETIFKRQMTLQMPGGLPADSRDL